MTTREQAEAAVEKMRESLCLELGDQCNCWACMTAVSLFEHLAQPEGGDVEDEIAYGRFEVREEDGRRFWWGAEDGWKDGDEIGEDGVLTINAQHFAVGTVLAMSEPVSTSIVRSALRSARESVPASDAMAAVRAVLRHAKEREAAAVERTVKKAKDVVLAYADCYQPTEKMLADLDSLKETP